MPTVPSLTSKPISTQNTDYQCLLIDLDGTLYTDNQPVPQAVESLDLLRSQGYTLRFLTNTTTKTAQQIYDHLRQLGFHVESNEIITPAIATKHFLLSQSFKATIWPIVAPQVALEFNDFKTDQTNPNFIIVGDIGEQWSYALLNQIFNALINGAKLIALHKNKYWQTNHGLHADIGLFINGLEYISGQQAIVIGKPSRDFFLAMLQSANALPQNTIVIGDDIESDVGGALRAGLDAILVQTGKYRPNLASQSNIQPTATIKSFAQLPHWLTAK